MDVSHRVSVSGGEGAAPLEALPGLPPYPSELAARLRAALAALGPGHRPRTHHLCAGDGGAALPRFTNRLVLESSPYLLQHAHNPVNWYPWGDEAFATARAEGKPVFLSIGYATCHWCHVMEGESFEDLVIAEYLNRHYVAIKVDREERPDVDAVYMSATQQLTGGGGWPMSVWLDAERRPFFAGTYFPPRAGARGARRGFLEILQELRATHARDPEKVARAAAELTRAVRADLEGDAGERAEQTAAGSAAGPAPGAADIARAVGYFARAFDPVCGGVRRAPKFPSSLPVRLLLRHHLRTGDAHALHMATFTLEKMAAGGLHDQVGGGFHRYSTDAEWLVPHFEKMLYDNALLAIAYGEAAVVTGRADFARVARTTLDYVAREMTAPEGGFYSATDADSEGVEGKFFVWSQAEITDTLGPEAGAFCAYYGVTAQGNFEGENILHVPEPDEATWSALAGARARLYEHRARREPPLRDEKILAAWNGLMISAFARVGFWLDVPAYVAAAARAADFVLGQMTAPAGLCRSWRDGRRLPHAFLEDYAFLIQAMLDLHEASFAPRWLREALRLAREQEARFADAGAGGWFTTAHDGERLLAREKPDHDGAEPSGTSIAILNALRLHAITGDDTWRGVAARALDSVAAVLRERGPAMAEALLALDFQLARPREVVLVWPAGLADAARPLRDVVRGTFEPARVLLGAEEGEALEALAGLAPPVAGKRARDGRATAYVCEQGRCAEPTSDPEVLRRQLCG